MPLLIPTPKIKIAKALDEFGFEYTANLACGLGPSLALTAEAMQAWPKCQDPEHTRCTWTMPVLLPKLAFTASMLSLGPHVSAASSRTARTWLFIIKQATEGITFIKSKGLEVRFSSEDSFAAISSDLLTLYKHVDKVGVPTASA